MAELLRNLTFEDYLAIDAVNFSTLKHINTSPLHYLDAATNGTPDKPAFALGRAAHTALLEPEHWQSRYIVKPDYVTREVKGELVQVQLKRDERMAEWRELLAYAAETGRTIITPEEYDLAQLLAQRVRQDPVASKRLEGQVDTEVTVLWTHEPTGLDIKCRLDVVNHSLRCLADPKTVAYIAPPRMWAHFERLLYLAQFALYSDAWHAVTGERWPFECIAIEKTRPFDIVVCAVTDEHLAYGRSLYETWLGELARCQDAGVWPGVARGEPLVFERPSWAQFGEDDEITGDEAA